MLIAAIEQIRDLNAEHLRLKLKMDDHQELSDQQRHHFEALQRFCAINGLRPFPAAPVVVAAFLETLPAAECIPAAEAIEAQHDIIGLSNPVATSAVRSVLASRVFTDYPQSWSKADRRVFATLDPMAQAIILRRETERDKALRTKQNQAAKAAQSEKKEIENVDSKTE
jgi:hypothetical protein